MQKKYTKVCGQEMVESAPLIPSPKYYKYVTDYSILFDL